ncbi:DUF255 domain-containing protein [Streptomyces sp. NPDC047097]|uniref:DUF255 domain-containing protein n=1 Tax=Streptomyces sp. NPDC047097 TaxID=3155260 RepID=UPI0033C6067D
MNRLAGETSPYLPQHADNPVDWWPWSPEVFEEARQRHVPVLLSVGYSSCHWCQIALGKWEAASRLESAAWRSSWEPFLEWIREILFVTTKTRPGSGRS